MRSRAQSYFTEKSQGGSSRLEPFDDMPPLIDSILAAMSRPRGGRPACLVCGRFVRSSDERLLLRGGTVVHRSCATYEMRRRRVGTGRLGYPPTP
jgi:hypothetical protein